MRISTSMIYDSGLAAMQNRTGTLLSTQQQLSTGRRMLAPSDDPVAAARALEITQSQAVNASQATTRNNAKSTLGISDSQLDSATDLMVKVRELTVQAGNAGLSGADRRSIATELRARFEEMVGLANSRDGTGQYLFGGYQTTSQPFAGSVENGVVYGGDDGARTLRVSGSRELAISDSGNDVFMRIKNGNGVFATGTQYEKSANSSSASIDLLQVSNTTAWADPVNSGNLKLNFWVDKAGSIGTAGLTYYDLVDATGASLYTNTRSMAGGVGNTFTRAYTSGATINLSGFDAAYNNPSLVPTAANFGASVVVRGQPGSGDSFAITRPAATVVAAPAVTDPAAWNNAVNSGNLQVRFWADATNALGGGVGAKYYDLVDATANLSLLTNAVPSSGAAAGMLPYTDGAAIPFSPLHAAFNNPSATPAGSPDFGASVTVTGVPANGDRVDVLKTGLIAPFGIGATPRSGQAASSVIQATPTQARAVIDRGAVSDPLKWAQTANTGKLEVRFWIDPTGSAGTAGQSVGTVPIPPGGMTVVAGTADQFTLNVDTAGARTVTIPPGIYTSDAAVVAAIQAGIDALVAPPVAASVSLDAGNRLVVDSVATGTSSSVGLTPGVGARNGLLTFFGAPVPTGGAASGGAAGTTYYDIVDAGTGESLFSGGASAAGGAGNTFTHVYTSDSRVSLSSAGGGALETFDYGASVKVSGIPATGDAFVIESSDAYNGNGYFVTDAKATTVVNTGSGIIGAGEVLDVTKWNSPLNSRNLEVRFWQDPLVTAPNGLYYDLVDKETEKSLFSDTTSTSGGGGNTFTHAFKANDSIKFSGLHANYSNSGGAGDFGISVTVQGTPASGDAFKIQPSESESVFETMGRLITDLESGAPLGTLGNTHFANEFGRVLTSIASIEDNFLRVRASIGSRLSEVDDLDTVGSNLDLQYSETLSRLQDLDYADAITKLTRQQMELQASQQSFARISQLSLFQYL